MLVKRNMEIREVENGFVVTTTLEKERQKTETAIMPYIRKEMVVDSLPKLMKAVKAFYDSEIVEEK